MKNKLGINEYRLVDIEREIINLKLNKLDFTFTFNEEEFNFSYLKKLHNFLFNDFYVDIESDTRNLDENEIKLVECILNKITIECKKTSPNIENIINNIIDIWELQPFVVGNTRTLLAYLKVIDEAFLLGLDVNVNQKIENNITIFKQYSDVNQKRLTKSK